MAQYVMQYRGLYEVICIAVPNKNGENYQILRQVFKDVPGIIFS